MDQYKYYSAYIQDPAHGWTGTHRLPLESAIYCCKAQKEFWPWPVAVAIVPDGADPAPYFAIAEKLAV